VPCGTTQADGKKKEGFRVKDETEVKKTATPPRKGIGCLDFMVREVA